MKFTLYTGKNTGGLVVEAALVKAGAAYDRVEIDTESGAQNAPGFVTLNPLRQVPVLTTPDGMVLTESAAIVLHLADLFPGRGLAPAAGTPAHGRILRWMLFMVTNLYEADLRYFYPARYTADPAGMAGVKTAAAARMANSFAIIEEALDPFVGGAQASIADAYLAMLIGWSPAPVPSAKLQAVLAAIKADTDYGAVWRRDGI